jgi:hypothetical protein
MTFSAPDALVLPARIASYELTRLIGRGAVGTVYEATDGNTGAAVAVKLVHPHLARDPVFHARLEQAAELASRLTSPYTARLFDYGEDGGRFYLAGQLVRGQTIREMLAAGRVSLSRALDIARQVALALEEAESKGLVHGDLRPGNIYLTGDGRVRVLDFGLTRRLQEGILTVAQDFGGTQLYAAPETFTSDVTHRSDIYSLGAVMFHLLTGQPPFQGRSLSELVRAHQREPLPAHLLDAYPDAVANMVTGCLAKDPAQRYASASELVVALEKAARAAALDSEQRNNQTIVAPRPAADATPVTLTLNRTGPAGGPAEQHTLRMSGALNIGTAADNDFVVPGDRTVSGHHARLLRQGGAYAVEDRGSRNGTFIERDGQAIRVVGVTPLQPGDTLRVGTTRLILAASPPVPPRPEPAPQSTVIARQEPPDEVPIPPPAPVPVSPPAAPAAATTSAARLPLLLLLISVAVVAAAVAIVWFLVL